MTASELKDLFLLLYDKATSSSAPGYEDNEIELFLNKAQLQYVKNHYDYKKNKAGEGVEETEKRRKELSELITFNSPTVSSSQTGTFTNGIFYDLPKDLMYTLSETAKIKSNDDCLDGNIIPVKPVTHDEYNVYINNPFKKPDSTLVWRMDFSSSNSSGIKRHELITDGTHSISQYNIRYIKTPRDINITKNITSELNPNVHEEIVEIAVRMATAVTDSQNYQIKALEQQINE